MNLRNTSRPFISSSIPSNPDSSTVTVAYTAHGDLNSRRADSDAKDIGIFSKDELNEIKIAFDHEKIINDCLSNVEKSV
ncbi:MAG: hypothetical protein II426_01630 [Methanobrevibacter sp.]|nr:hypothetical protein [Methanobrevibacter sp.]